MEYYKIFIFGIILLSYYIPYKFIKVNSSTWEKLILSESRTYQNPSNFIEIKKYEFENFDKQVIFILGTSITLFLAVKLAGFGSIISYVILVVGMISSLSTFINLGKPHRNIIKKLYQLKDKNSKSL